MIEDGSPLCGSWRIEPRTGHALRRFVAGGDAYDLALSCPLPDPGSGPFPLIVMTDAALHFDAMASVVAALARRPAKTGVRSAAVLGIASGIGWSHDPARRERDLVPDPPDDRLLVLLRDTVLPAVRHRLPVDDGRIALFGHSFGGLFVLDALLRAPSLFHAGVAVSPSLWRVPELGTRLASPEFDASRFLLVSGSREPPRRPAIDDVWPAGGGGPTRLRLDDEDHGSIPFAAMPAALRFLARCPPSDRPDRACGQE